ncbi:stage II sporulation protein P [Paenibacillus thailandensis]
MLGMELPSYETSQQSETLSGHQIGSFVMRLLTDINPSDPKSLLASQMPGMKGNEAFLIRKGEGTDASVGPEDNEPIVPDEPAESDEPQPTGAPAETEKPEPTAPPGELNGGKAETKKNVVFIYHSHNQESWFPELEEGAETADSTTTNITLVGKRLAEKLEERGIGTVHSDTNYAQAIPDYDYAYSYKYSKATVKEAMASEKSLKYFFDIHRDSNSRKHTTTTINGKSYAQVYFVIGHKNPNWEQNEAFAAKIQTALEKKYKGLSRGIWGKSQGNGEYNQSLSPGSVLIEIGGVDNTLEECYRTADALAEVIADLYWEDAEEVMGPAS